jgi:hypothetical protein
LHCTGREGANGRGATPSLQDTHNGKQLFKRILPSEKFRTGKPGLEFQYLETTAQPHLILQRIWFTAQYGGIEFQCLETTAEPYLILQRTWFIAQYGGPVRNVRHF